MNSEADFIAAIAASPDDELLLRAFSDWLEERGDERATWVRSPQVRRWMGEKFESPIPTIIKVLKSRKGAVEVRRAVAEIGAAIVPELLPLLKDEDSYVRLQAVWCVRKVGKSATAAVPALLELLKDLDHQVREQAMRALEEIGLGKGNDTTNLRDLVSDHTNPLQYSAASILRRMGAKDAVADELVNQLATGDARAREAAIEGLKNLDSPAAIEPLCRALSDHESDVRAAAAAALSHLSKHATAQAVAPLRAALADPVARVRHRATWALRGLRQEAADAVDDLLTLLRDDPEVRGNAALALGDIATGDERVLAALVATLSDENLDTARSAAYALKNWPSLPAETSDALVALGKRLEQDGRCPVLEAMGKLETPSRQLLTLLRRVLRRIRRPGTEFAYATNAAEVLTRLGPAATEAIPELVIATRIGNAASARALGCMGEPGVEALVGLLHEEDEEARSTAIYGLRSAGASAIVALPWLRQCVREGDDQTRRSAVATIRVLGLDAQEAIPDLLGLFMEQSTVADAAREVLEEFRACLASHLTAIDTIIRTQTGAPWAQVRATRLLAAVAFYIPESVGTLREALRLGTMDGPEAAQLRRYAVEGLGELRSADTLADVLPLLGDADENVRREAAVALGKLDSLEAVPVLVKALRDPGKGVRARAAQALGKLKASDVSVVLALNAAEKDEDRGIRAAAKAALKKIHSKRKG